MVPSISFMGRPGSLAASSKPLRGGRSGAGITPKWLSSLVVTVTLICVLFSNALDPYQNTGRWDGEGSTSLDQFQNTVEQREGPRISNTPWDTLGGDSNRSGF